MRPDTKYDMVRWEYRRMLRAGLTFDRAVDWLRHKYCSPDAFARWKRVWQWSAPRYSAPYSDPQERWYARFGEVRTYDRIKRLSRALVAYLGTDYQH